MEREGEIERGKEVEWEILSLLPISLFRIIEPEMGARRREGERERRKEGERERRREGERERGREAGKNKENKEGK